MSSSSVTISFGAGIGTALACAISWSVNQSIWWGIFHGFCGWFYIIYYALGNGR